LHPKRLKLREITTEPFNGCGQNAYTSPNIEQPIHDIKLGRIDRQTQHVGGRSAFGDLDTEILSFPLRLPFCSVRMTADALAISPLAIYPPVLKKIRLKIFLIRWISHKRSYGRREK
jgi:hypothetical protein